MTAPDSADPGTPATAVPPSEKRGRSRRRRRRLLWLLIVVGTTSVIAWSARLSLAEFALRRLLPGQLEEALSLDEVTVDTLRFERRGVGMNETPRGGPGLVLTIDGLAGHGEGNQLDGERIEIHLAGLRAAIRDPIRAIRSVTVARIAWESTGGTPTTVPRVPRLLAPSQLPEVSFPVEVERWEYRTAGGSIHGSAQLQGGEVRVDGVFAGTGRESAASWAIALRARYTRHAIESLRVRSQHVTATGSARLQDGIWTGTVECETLAAPTQREPTVQHSPTQHSLPPGSCTLSIAIPTAEVLTTAEHDARAIVTLEVPAPEAPISGAVELRTRFDTDSAATIVTATGTLTAAGGMLELQGALRPGAATLAATLANFDPGPLLARWLPANHAVQSPLAGSLSWELNERDGGAIPALDFQLEGAAPAHVTGPDVNETISELFLAGSYGAAGLRLDTLRVVALDDLLRIGGSVLPGATEEARQIVATLQLGDGELAARGTVKPTGMNLQVTCRALDTELLARRFARESPWSGTFDGTATVTGPFAAPRVAATLTSARGSLPVAGESLGYQDLAIRGLHEDGTITLEECTVRAFDGQLTATGELPVGPDARWQAALQFRDIDVAGVQPWTSVFRDLRGRITGSASVSGPRAQPGVTARCRLRDGEIAFTGWERVRSLSADLSYADGQLRFDEVSGEAGGGTLQGSGSWDLRGELAAITAQLDVDEIILVRSPDLSLRVRGQLALAGTSASSTLTGELEVTRGLYRRNYYPQLRGGAPMSFDLFSLGGFFANTQWNVPLHLGGRLQLDNNRVQLAPQGTVTLRGTGAVPYLVGQIQASSGLLRLPHLRVNISYTEFEFPEANPYQPRLQFVGTGVVRDYDVTVNASGTLDALEVEFRSTPELADEDLLVLIATGRLPRHFAEGGAEQAAATELAMLYGPQVWEWLFGQSSGGFFEDLTVTTQVAERNEASDQITVEYRLRDGVSVVGEQDKRGDMNVDVRFFWWFP